MEAAQRWFGGACDDAQVVREVAESYARLVALWHKQRTLCKASASSASA
jgi:myo-inositol catabolism protein IolC